MAAGDAMLESMSAISSTVLRYTLRVLARVHVTVAGGLPKIGILRLAACTLRSLRWMLRRMTRSAGMALVCEPLTGTLIRTRWSGGEQWFECGLRFVDRLRSLLDFRLRSNDA
jgi:hypothetical protein